MLNIINCFGISLGTDHEAYRNAYLEGSINGGPAVQHTENFTRLAMSVPSKGEVKNMVEGKLRHFCEAIVRFCSKLAEGPLTSIRVLHNRCPESLDVGIR